MNFDIVSFIPRAVMQGIPLLYGSTGEILTEKSGNLNLGIPGNVYLSCGDYAANDRTYAIKVDASQGLTLSQTSARLHPGQSFDLSVNNNTGSTAPITRTSSNPEVATVDEFGHVVAVAPGQAIITVSNGTYSALCVIAVKVKVWVSAS